MFIGTSAPRPLHFAYRDTEDYRDVKEAVPHNSFIGTLAPHYLGVFRKEAVPHNFVALTEQIPYSGIITF